MPRILVSGRRRRSASDLEGRSAKNGYEVDVAHDGIGALNKLWINSYDLALTDVMMPGIGGFELMSIAKKIPPALDFFVITGNGSPENREEGNPAGRKGLYQKTVYD